MDEAFLKSSSLTDVCMSDYTRMSYKILSYVSAEAARKFFLEEGYFTQQGIFPGIIVSQNLSNIKLQDIDWNKPNSIPRTHPIRIIGQKPNKGIREFSLIHPFSYIHVVNEFTERTMWNDIRSKLTATTAVQVYSVPLFGRKLELGTSAWSFFKNIDPAKFYLTHNTDASTDIQNFYSSIYTHSIPWVLVGKERAKQSTRDMRLAANRIDKLMQNANDGQTNGIPTGNEISDLIAELLLKDIDEKISSIIYSTHSKAFRYRDDYKFLCKDYQTAKKLIDALSVTLNSEYNLVLNSNKTEIKHVGADYQAADKKFLASILADQFPEEITNILSGRVLHTYLKSTFDAHTYAQDKHYFDNCLRRLVIKFKNKKLEISELGVWAEASVFVLLNAISSGFSSSTYGYAVIDEILREYSKTEETKTKEIINKIVDHYFDSESILIKLWVYMLILSNYPEIASTFLANNDSEIFKMAKNKSVSNVRFFNTRDSISPRDLIELDKFILIKNDLFEKIKDAEESIVDSLADDEFEDWISVGY